MKSIFFFFTFFASLNAWSGSKVVGNGGDAFSIEFIAVAEKIHQYLQQTSEKNLDLHAFARAIAETRVESTYEPLAINGIPKDAINRPHLHHILFNRNRWLEMDAGQKPALVLHEYLGILGLEDASYVISKKLLGAFKYDRSSIDCQMDGGTANFLVESENSGIETVLLFLNQKDRDLFGGQINQAQGSLSKMLKDGMISIAFKFRSTPESTLVSLISLRRQDGGLFQGFLAHRGIIRELSCQVLPHK